MAFRSLTFAAFASGAFLFPGAGAPAPVTLRYRIAQQTQQTIDASAVGQGEQRVNLGYVAFLTVTLNDSAGGRSVRAKLDSIAPDSGVAPQFAQPIASAKGAIGAGFLDATGTLTGFRQQGDTNMVVANTLRGLVSSLFPKVKASARSGETWTDTTETSDTTAGAPVKRRAVTNYKASDGTSTGGQKTMKIDLSGSYSITGTAPNGMAYEGTGKSSASFHRSAQGWMVEGSFNDNADLELTIPQAPTPIPVANVSTVSIALLK